MTDLQTAFEDSFVKISFDEELYPKSAIYGAAYVFIDRCFVYLDRPAAGKVTVRLAPKPTVEQSLQSLVGEFGNELLGQAWRHQIAEQNKQILELVTARAMAGAAGPPGLDDLLAMDDDAEAFDDPLGIAMSWEDKYKKKKKPGEDAADAEQAAGETAEEGESQGEGASEAPAAEEAADEGGA